MKGKKILISLLAAAVAAGTMAFPAFAAFETVEKLSETDVLGGYSALTEDGTIALSSAEAFETSRDAVTEYTTDTVVYNVSGKVTVNGTGWVNILKASATGVENVKTVKFIGLTNDAEINIAKGPTLLAWQGYALNVEFENLTLSNSDPKEVNDAGHGTKYFTTWLRCTDAASCSVSYKNCTFTNGSCNNQYGKTVYTDCAFNNASDYCLWLYGGDTEVTGTKNTFVGKKGVKLYSEDATKAVNATIGNAEFDISDKPAVVASTWGKLELNNVDASKCQYGILSSEPNDHTKDGALINDTLADSTIDGKAPAFVAKVGKQLFTNIEAAKKEAGSTGTVEDVIAQIGSNGYTSLEDAVAAALASGENETVTMLCNANGNGIIIPAGANITIDFGGYSYTIDGTLVGSKGSETNGFQLLKDANVTLKNGTIISSKLAKWGPTTDNAANATGANIVIQNYSNLRLENITIDGDQSAVTEGNPSAAYARYVLSNNNGNTVLTGNTNIIAAPGNYAFDVYGGWYPAYPSVTVTLDENMTGTITGKIQVSNGQVAEPDNFKLSIKNGTIDGTIQDDRSAAQKEAYPKLNAVSGGSFTTDVSDYCEEGFAPRFVNGKYVVGEDNSATTIKLIFKQPDANDNTLYNIVLAGVEKNINRLNAAEFEFVLTTTDAITYEIAAADGLALIPQADGKYEFHFDGKDFTGSITDTGAEIVIGTVKFEGYGKFTFSAETGRATATTTEDNLVTDFVVGGDAGKGTLIINEEESKIDTEIKVPKQTLTINIAMNHPVEDNVSAYQDMKVVISGGDLAGETLTFKLGTDDKAIENGVYNFGVELTQNRLYTVTVSGAGYRTARYTVAMTEDKTMNFWNNVMSKEITVVDDVKDTVNFLAGDIVKDGKINIYDLSAVVAYFGTENNQAEYSKFAKYDLNRDGKIDMMDISIVLTSWGK